MKIKVKKRVKGLKVETWPHLFSSAGNRGLEFDSTCGGARVELSRAELINAVIHLAPFNKSSRDEFFKQLREEADRKFPTWGK